MQKNKQTWDVNIRSKLYIRSKNISKLNIKWKVNVTVKVKILTVLNIRSKGSTENIKEGRK